jgi:hypothetical protein
MDTYQQIREWLAEMKAKIAAIEARLDKYDEATGRSQADTEAKRRRRGMHSMAIIPAAVQQSPVASAVVALTASAIIGAMVVTHPGGGGVRDTERGVIAGQRPPAPTAEALPPRDLRRPEAAPPVSVRPVPSTPAPKSPPKAQTEVQTVDLKPVRRSHQRLQPAAAPMSTEEASDPPACVVRVVVVLHLRVRLCRQS